MKNPSTKIPEKVRQTMRAIAPLLVVIILFMVVGKFGISKVVAVRGEISSAQKAEAALTQKLSILQTLSPDISIKANLIASAFPDANPSLALISQLKTLALNQGVLISSLKSSSGSVNSSGLYEAGVTFTLDGVRPQVFGFLNGVAKIAPITIVNKINMTENAGSISADVSVRAFWKEFPKTIPSVTDPIADLTAAEKVVLTNVAGLTQPTFTEVVPSQENLNPNPFGQ